MSARCVVAAFALCIPSAVAGPLEGWGELPRPGGAQDMAELMELVQTVSLARMVNGRLEESRVRRARIKDCCPECVTVDGRHYYDSVATASRVVVIRCLERAALPTASAWVRVREDREVPCREADSFWERDLDALARSRYRIARREDGVHLGVKVRYRFEGEITAARRAQMLESVRACVPPMRDVFARYAIQLEYELDTAEAPTAGEPDAEVTLADTEGRSDDQRYDFLGLFWGTCLSHCTLSDCSGFCEEQRQYFFCHRLLHETGHLFGLVDEYPEPSVCPDRESVFQREFPWNVMDNDQMPWDEIEFYPHHLRRIVAPLCR